MAFCPCREFFLTLCSHFWPQIWLIYGLVKNPLFLKDRQENKKLKCSYSFKNVSVLVGGASKTSTTTNELNGNCFGPLFHFWTTNGILTSYFPVFQKQRIFKQSIYQRKKWGAGGRSKKNSLPQQTTSQGRGVVPWLLYKQNLLKKVGRWANFDNPQNSQKKWVKNVQIIFSYTTTFNIEVLGDRNFCHQLSS